MIQPMMMARSTKAMKAPISGQNTRGTLYNDPGGERRGGERRAPRGRAASTALGGRRAPRGAAGEDRRAHAWSATCSLALGNAHATCIRRSWRKTKRIWLGG